MGRRILLRQFSRHIFKTLDGGILDFVNSLRSYKIGTSFSLAAKIKKVESIFIFKDNCKLYASQQKELLPLYKTIALRNAYQSL